MMMIMLVIMVMTMNMVLMTMMTMMVMIMVVIMMTTMTAMTITTTMSNRVEFCVYRGYTRGGKEGEAGRGEVNLVSPIGINSRPTEFAKSRRAIQ